MYRRGYWKFEIKEIRWMRKVLRKVERGKTKTGSRQSQKFAVLEWHEGGLQQIHATTDWNKH
jgi:hypothetical protein